MVVAGALNGVYSVYNAVLVVRCLYFCIYRVFTFSDDEEEEKRVVRSQKDKRCVFVCRQTAFPHF